MPDAIRFVEKPARADLDALDDALYKFNQEATGHRDGRDLATFLRDEQGVLRAGLSGNTWGGCCHIQMLFVRASERRTGLGSALLAAAEREALARGCDRIRLSTHSFQAPEFYRRHGYVEVGRIEDFPRGHAQIFLMKLLSPERASRA